jgi:hypothetical protein
VEQVHADSDLAGGHGLDGGFEKEAIMKQIRRPISENEAPAPEKSYFRN